MLTRAQPMRMAAAQRPASHVVGLVPSRLMSLTQVRANAPGNSSGAGYYPSVPASAASEPSAPYLPNDSYATSYAPSTSTSFVSEKDQKAAAEMETLRESAGTTRTLSTLGFWAQFALSVVSGGILLFSAAFVPKAAAHSAVNDLSKWLTLVGVAASFISSLMAHGFLTLSRRLQDGGNVSRQYVVGTLLTNNAICLAGIAITVIGLQASVGTLVAKSLMTAMSGPYQVSSTTNSLVSLDVFALQASTNTLLCHVIGLLFTNLMLRIVNRAPKDITAAPVSA